MRVAEGCRDVALVSAFPTPDDERWPWQPRNIDLWQRIREVRPPLSSAQRASVLAWLRPVSPTLAPRTPARTARTRVLARILPRRAAA